MVNVFGELDSKKEISSEDKLLIGDKDTNEASNETVGDVVKAGIGDVTTDDLKEGKKNKYLSATDKEKLDKVEPGANKNNVESVNKQQGEIELTQDSIPSGKKYAQTENNYSKTEKAKVQANKEHSEVHTGNPHKVTAKEIGLDKVVNAEQLTVESDEYKRFDEKLNVNDNDKFLLESSTHKYAKKLITIKTFARSIMSAFGSILTGSIESVNGILQLANDKVNPSAGEVYGTDLTGSKGRQSTLPVTHIEENETLTIPRGRAYITYGAFDLRGEVQLQGDLVLL